MEGLLQPIFSVSEFIEYVNIALGGRQVTVEGEIASFRISQGKWVFFDLKDDQSIVNCFSIAYRLLCALEDGMQVRVTGTPRVHPKSGKFSITADRIELAGIGSLKRAFELTKAKLEKEGIFAPERKRALPRFPSRIGLIASRESAAYTDFMRIMAERWGGCEILLMHVHVQGEQAVQDIVSAIQYFNENDTGIETLALIRGGGSMEDLQAFNTEGVARAIFGSRIPLVSGIGHERDETLSDYAADVRAATPTHAAALIVPDRQEILRIIDANSIYMEESMKNEINRQKQRIEFGIQVIQRVFSAHIHAFHALVEHLYADMRAYEIRLKHMGASLYDQQNLFIMRMEQKIKDAKNNLLSFERNMGNMNPLMVLKRGYGIIRKKGRAISHIQDVSVGDRIDIQLSDGTLPATVSSPQGTLSL
ncbi:exodeoxyribonuclease VII large subunit [Candidatus Uhrbacteria bacterium]|nr:exodeoxyribonuclease VII large subunit [Candidatus Uhrbacteria bacterium]